MGHRPQDGHGQFGSHAAGSEQDAEQVTIGLGAKAIQTQIVLAHMGVGVHHHFLAHSGQGGDATRRHCHLVANTTDFDTRRLPHVSRRAHLANARSSGSLQWGGPKVAEGYGQGVGGVGRPWRLGQP